MNNASFPAFWDPEFRERGKARSLEEAKEFASRARAHFREFIGDVIRLKSGEKAKMLWEYHDWFEDQVRDWREVQ